MTTNKELLSIREANTPRGVGTQTNIFADKAKNAEIWDVEGNHYIDLAAGILNVNIVRGNVIRFLPPLTIEPELMAKALDIVGNTIKKLSVGAPVGALLGAR